MQVHLEVDLEVLEPKTTRAIYTHVKHWRSLSEATDSNVIPNQKQNKKLGLDFSRIRWQGFT